MNNINNGQSDNGLISGLIWYRCALVFSLFGFTVMSAVIMWALTMGDFFSDGSKLVRMSWGIVSLVDLYTGFILVSFWIWFREKSWIVALLWTVAMMVLGNFTFSFYVTIHLAITKGDFALFFLGISREKYTSSSLLTNPE